jgi:ABC-type amino acid transport substrate-binding protein
MLLFCIYTPYLFAAENLVIGVFAYRPKAELQQQWQPFAEYLNKSLPGKSFKIEVLDEMEIKSALFSNRLDFIFTNPTIYINLRTQNSMSGAIATAIRSENNRPVSALGGVILVRKERTDLNDINDLYGKRIVSTGPFLGTYHSQLYEITKINPELAKSLKIDFIGQPLDKTVYAIREAY